MLCRLDVFLIKKGFRDERERCTRLRISCLSLQKIISEDVDSRLQKQRLSPPLIVESVGLFMYTLHGTA